MVNNLLINDRSFWKDKKVFVTGHSGFKGSWLTLWLLKLGANVWGLSLPLSEENLLFKQLDLAGYATETLTGGFVHIEGDINDFTMINSLVRDINPDVVFHLAADDDSGACAALLMIS